MAIFDGDSDCEFCWMVYSVIFQTPDFWAVRLDALRGADWRFFLREYLLWSSGERQEDSQVELEVIGCECDPYIHEHRNNYGIINSLIAGQHCF